MMRSKPQRFFSNRRADLRPRSTFSIPPTSLLWPISRPPAAPSKGAAAVAWESDLGLGELAQYFSSDRRYLPFIRSLLAALTTDPQVIAWRQAVLADFVANPIMAEKIDGLLGRFVDLRQGNALFGQRRKNLLLETSDRLAELELYVAIVQDLYAALQEAHLQSPALTKVCDDLAMLLADENFQSLQAELPDLRAPLENIRSLTIGINLDMQLQPASAVLLAINPQQIGESVSLLDRLIGTRAEDTEETGIAPLHVLPKNPDERPFSPLFQDLDRLMTQIAQPIARALTKYVRTSSAAVAGLEDELAFYGAALKLMKRMGERGVAFCQPEIAPIDECVTQIEGLVNINLALRSNDKPVPNPVEFGVEGRIALLTGPNSGGKTTYLQSVGLAQAMFQAGLFIPAKAARLSPIDAILTHFPQLETRQQGRLAEEASRLRTLFSVATGHSLILLNETFSSTSSGEALYLAQDILCGLRVIGVRAIFATHLVELVGRIDEIEAVAAGESRLFSLVAGVRLIGEAQAVPTYQITRGQPLGKSYAQEIARRHGISLEQILATRNS